MSTTGSVRQSLWTVGIAIAAWLAWMLRDLVILIGLSALLAYALDPVVSLLERVPLPRRRSIPRGVAAGLVMVTLVLVMAWALASAVPRLVHEISRFVDSAPAALDRLEETTRRFVESHGWTGLMGSGATGSSSFTSSLLHTAQEWAISLLRGLVGNLGQLVGLVVLPLFAFYLLADGEAVRSSALRFVPQNLRPQAVRFLNAIDPALRAYVRGQSLVCLIMGGTMAFVLHLLGYPVAFLLGVTVGIAEVVPFLGFWIAVIAITLAGFATSPGLALAGLGAYVVVNNLMGYLVTPRLLGRQVKIHPFLVTVSILGGTALLGPAGGILAIPAAAIAQAVIAEFGPPPSKQAPVHPGRGER